MTPPLARRLAAEAFGSALLFGCVVGSGIMAERLSGGNTGVALLANTIATAAMLYVLIGMFARVSGAHFNPAVSMVMALRRELPASEAGLYAIAQCAAGVAGVWIAHLMFGEPVWQLSTKLRQGHGQWLGEAVATFGLVLTIIGTAPRQPDRVPASVALYIAAAYWFTSSTSFANPAITLARSLSDSFAGIAAASAPGFIAAQVAGALLAALIGGWLFAEAEQPPG